MKKISFDITDKITLGNYLEYWFETFSKRNIKQSTAVSYRGFITNHITPQIGSYKLSELNTNVFQEFFNYEYDQGNLKGEGGLSAKTIHNIALMLHKAMKKAVDLELISRNYIECVDLPKTVKPQIKILSPSDQGKLMSVLKTTDEKLSNGVYLALATGLRIGEILGLQWGDIDFDNQILYVRRTANRLNTIGNEKVKTELVVGEPKSHNSIRDIPLNDAICDMLKKQYDKERKYLGKRSLKNNDFVFTLNYGKPTDPKTMQDCFKRLIKEAGVTGVTFHSLRHTFATRAIEMGINVKTLSVLLGHSDVSVTLDRYVHIHMKQKRKAMDILLADFAS